MTHLAFTYRNCVTGSMNHFAVYVELSSVVTAGDEPGERWPNEKTGVVHAVVVMVAVVVVCRNEGVRRGWMQNSKPCICRTREKSDLWDNAHCRRLQRVEGRLSV